jgi:hypothetical protein
MNRAILAKVCQCKPNRRSCGQPEFKQGINLLKVNYFASDCYRCQIFDGANVGRDAGAESVSISSNKLFRQLGHLFVFLFLI